MANLVYAWIGLTIARTKVKKHYCTSSPEQPVETYLYLYFISLYLAM